MSDSRKRRVEELEKELEYTKKLLYENALVSLLNGRQMASLYENSEITNLNLNFEVYSYILLSVSTDSDEEGNSPKCAFIDEHLTEAVNGFGYVSHYLYHHGCMNYIIASDDERMESNVVKTLERLLKTTQEKLGFGFYAGVGGVYRTRSGIARSCRESRRALEYCLSEKKGKIIEHRKVSGGATYNYFYSETTEHQLINAVKINNKEKLNKVLDQIFDDCVIDGSLSLNIVRIVSNNLFDTLGTIFSAAGYSGSKVFPEEYKFMRAVYQKTNAREIIKIIRSMYERCYEELYSEQTERSAFIDKVTAFIEKNYQRPDFNLQAVGDEFDLSKGYLARIFRKEYGTSINDYIKIARVNKAKELLENTNDLIDSIVTKSGFSNYRTFSRAFKELVGLLPKDYRKKQAGGYR